jgi:hypothetical protein
VPDTSDIIENQKRIIDRLNGILQRTQMQQQYWYSLWFSMCREHAASQNALIEQIDELRRKHGEWDGRSYLDGLLQRSFDQKYVRTKHPAAAAGERFAAETIDAPPKREKPVEPVP